MWRLTNDLVKILTTRLEELKQGIARPLAIKAPSAPSQTQVVPPTKKFGATRSASVDDQLSVLAQATPQQAPNPLLRKSTLHLGNGSTPPVSVNGTPGGGGQTPLDKLPEWTLQNLTETSVDDDTATQNGGSRPSTGTRARWERPSEGAASIKTAWTSLDDDEEFVDEDDDIEMSPGVVVGEDSSPNKTLTMSNGSKIVSPPKGSRIWSRLPAAGPLSPRQSTTSEEQSITPGSPPGSFTGNGADKCKHLSSFM